MSRVDYPDFVSWSPGRRWRLEVADPASAARAANPYGSYASRFSYALYAADASAPLWTRKHRGDGQPVIAWVSDDGWVVIGTRAAQHVGLVALSPAGQRTRTIDLAALLGPSLAHTTAGPGWGGAGTRGEIISIAGKPVLRLEDPELELELDATP